MITLNRRQSLSSRIQNFGGANGRGSRRFRFGDSASDRAIIEAELAAMDAGATGPRNHDALIQNTDWGSLFVADAAWARNAYARINAASLDPEYQPTIDVWFEKHGGNPTVTVPVVTNVPVTTPGTTDAAYQAAVAAAQIEAARLEAVAAANRKAADADAKRIAAEDVLKAKLAADAAQATEPVKKSSMLPLVLAAGAAYLLLKG